MSKLRESIRKIYESYVSDYIESDTLHRMMRDPGFGRYTDYNQLNGMIVQTNKLENEAFPGAKDAYSHRYWKFSRTEDGWEAREVDEYGVDIPRGTVVDLSKY